AVVARVDRPDNCLRIRSGPSMSDNVIGCAAMGQTLNLTGAFSKDGRWAQLDNNGWVYFHQLRTDLMPPKHARSMTSGRRSSRSWERAAGAGSGSYYSEGAYMPYTYYYGSPYYSTYRPGFGNLFPPLNLPPLPSLPFLP
ncbi:MAG TPA: SH3 domain-containing protein, partial [Desulfomonilaceae bacterium]|nr:SH3 domain-containing protein [Desulfomonilaceae bacterium]